MSYVTEVFHERMFFCRLGNLFLVSSVFLVFTICTPKANVAEDYLEQLGKLYSWDKGRL